MIVPYIFAYISVIPQHQIAEEESPGRDGLNLDLSALPAEVDIALMVFGDGIGPAVFVMVAIEFFDGDVFQCGMETGEL